MNASQTPESPDAPIEVQLQVNGRAIRRHVSSRMHLADFLRHELHLTATHVGCEHGVCGACTVRLDGDIVRGCLVLAVQAEAARSQRWKGLMRPVPLPISRRPWFVTMRFSAGSARPACCSARPSCLSVRPPPIAPRSGIIFPAIIATVRDITPSSAQWRRWRRSACAAPGPRPATRVDHARPAFVRL